MSKQNFANVTPSVNYPEMETQILDLWKQKDVFRRSMAEREDGPRYVFFEGPPTANGRPGIHHVLARAFKDMFPRYKTMQGHHVLRKGGWDTHGLPVEIEVEKQLGLSGKQQIEEYGVEAFNQTAENRSGPTSTTGRSTDRAHGLLGGHGRPLCHLAQRLCRVPVVDPEAVLGKGSALLGLQSRALLPPLWHAPEQP